MIFIKVYGLDQFIIGDYAKEHTDKIAQILEISPDELLFCSSESIVFHKGDEQINWNVLVELCLLENMHPVQEQLFNYISKTLNLYAMHIHFIFHYDHEHHMKSYINSDYPKFLTEKNTVNVEEHHHCGDEECDCHKGEEEIYTGNIFEGIDLDKHK